MKALIIASRNDVAAMNIVRSLQQFGKFNILETDGEILETNNIPKDKLAPYELIIFASRHRSKANEKALTVHTPGNWRDALYGGTPKKICPTSAQYIKFLFQELNRHFNSSSLKDFRITLEATHHGPLIEKPCVFIEIGSTMAEWRDPKAGFVVAQAIASSLENFIIRKQYEIAIGIGGSHYCPSFNKVQLQSNVALSHIIPNYALPASELMIQEAIEKTLEPVDYVLIDWNSVGNSFARQQLLDVLSSMKVPYRQVSEVLNPK